jgi:hypothetical protein
MTKSDERQKGIGYPGRSLGRERRHNKHAYEPTGLWKKTPAVLIERSAQQRGCGHTGEDRQQEQPNTEDACEDGPRLPRLSPFVVLWRRCSHSDLSR